MAAQEGGAEKLSTAFYAILFTDYPDARDFFPAAMATQRDRLVRAIGYAIDQLEEPETLMPFLAQLGRDHRKYGVEDVHYTAVANSLIKALRNFPGNEMWTDEAAAAWDEVLGVMGSAMMSAANAETTPAAWGATVLERREELRDVAIVRLQLDEPMEYAAGQYVSVQVPSRPRMWRYLSPAIPANKQGEIEFHVRGVTGGWVSPSIVGHTAVGERWAIGSPLGSLGIPTSGKDMLMIGSGTGIAPMRAQVMEMVQRSDNPDVHVFIAGHRPCDLYDLATLWHLSVIHPWLTITAVSEHDDNPWWYEPGMPLPGLENRLTGQIGKIVADSMAWAGRDVQIAGSPSMVQTTKFRLMSAGATNIRHDPLY